MNELKCPSCEKYFSVDDAGYANLLKQVRVEEFSTELSEKMAVAEREKLSALELAKVRN